MIERRRAAAHAFVIDINAPFLNDDDFHHLAKVLRLRSGETVSVSDGRGSWRICHYEMSAALAIGDSVVHIETNPRSLSVAFSVTKNDKPDLVIQKLTELGIDHTTIEINLDSVKAGLGVELETNSLTYRELQQRRELIQKRMRERVKR